MKLACFTIFVCLNYSTSFSNDDFSSFNNSTTGGETVKEWITNFKIKMSQFARQELWQYVPQHYCVLDTLVLQVNQNKTSPLKSTQKGTTARWCDIRREILEFFVAQCTLVKSGAVQSGQMQCILVKSNQFENSFPLLYIFLKSCLCCCSLASLAAQQKLFRKLVLFLPATRIS